MQSIAQWQARHSPQYMIAMEKLQTQRQIAYETEERRHSNQLEIQNRSNSQQWELTRYKEEQAVQAENIRGKNRLAELDRELDNKLKIIGTEAQVAMTMKLVDELAKNRDFFRSALDKRADFRADMQKAILMAMIAKKQGIDNHTRDIEKMRLEAELRARQDQIDDYAKKAIAYGEIIAKKEGDEAATRAINSIVDEWEMSFSV